MTRRYWLGEPNGGGIFCSYLASCDHIVKSCERDGEQSNEFLAS